MYAAGGLAGDRRGDEGGVVGGVDEADAGDDDEEDDEELDPDEHQVDPHRLFDPHRDQDCQSGHQQERQQVEVRPRGDHRGDGDPELAEEQLGVLRPPLGHDAGPEHKLEQEVPADDPGDDLAEGGIRERVRRTRDRHR